MPDKATLALFAYDGVEGATALCLVEEARAAPWLQVWAVGNDALICRARSKTASRFWQDESHGDVLVMLDHDIVWDVGTVAELIGRCRETKGVVSGLYPRRTFGEGAPARFLDYGEYHAGADEMVRAALLPAGFLALHREAIQSVVATLRPTVDNIWPFFIPLLWDGAYWGEDYAFSFRARDAGVPLYVWLKPRLRHIGKHEYRLIDGATTLTQDETVTLNVQHPIIASLPDDIAKYLEISHEEAARFLLEGTGRLATLWDAPVDEGAWYQRSDVGQQYLFDLAHWHLNGGGSLIQNQTADIQGQRVLDFGAGIGTWTVILADRGNRVEYVEPNRLLRNFIRWRAEQRGLSVTSVEVPDGPYDVAVVWHVLEHVGDPRGTAERIAKHLAPGGLLITDSDFHRRESHPMHHELPEGQAGDDLWAAAELRQEGPYRWRKPTEASPSSNC